MFARFSHVVLCVRDLDRSIDFYERLGFQAFFDFTQEDLIAGAVIGEDVHKVRMAFMQLGRDHRVPFLDLVQFIDPPTNGAPYPTLNNVGICRLAFMVDDIEQTCRDLEDMGVDFVTPLHRFETPTGDSMKMVCFRDPDGIYLELITDLGVERPS